MVQKAIEEIANTISQVSATIPLYAIKNKPAAATAMDWTEALILPLKNFRTLVVSVKTESNIAFRLDIVIR